MSSGRYRGTGPAAEVGSNGARSRLSVVPHAGDALSANRVRRQRIRVLVVGGHQLFADALAIVVGSDPSIEVVGTERDAEQAPARIRRTQPDVVLLNHFHEDSDCADVIARLRSEDDGLKVIVLTSAGDTHEALYACVQAGAAGHQTTDRQPTELVDSIKRVHAGEMVFSPDVLVNLMTRPRPAPPPRPALATPQPLAPRELQVLQAVASGMSTGDAAVALGITVHTVRAHLKNVMTKLQAHSKLEAVIVALKRGLIELPD